MRSDHPRPSPRVEYELTEFGRSLGPFLEVMQACGRALKARRLAEEPERDVSAP